ncbi:MAG TPA: hypothetical protein VF269_02795 [Rhodanobacteraceae bacterium]
MNTTDESIAPDSVLKRALWRTLLVCCGIGLFVIAGIIGALVILYWVI